MVDKDEHPGDFACNGCDLWQEWHGFNWYIDRIKHLACKGGHKEDKSGYKNKCEWAQKKPKTPEINAHGGSAITPASAEANTTSKSPSGRTLIEGGEITHQQLDSDPDVYVSPPMENAPLKKSNNIGPISKALYKEKESELSIALNLMKQQQQEIKRLRDKLSYFRRAEKAKVGKGKYAVVINKQGPVPDAAKNNINKQLKDVRSKKEIFIERVNTIMDSDPVFKNG
jgi:hypothetical protein